MRLSNRAWPWFVEKDGGVYLVWRWYGDTEVMAFKSESDAKKCADDLNLKDYGTKNVLV